MLYFTAPFFSTSASTYIPCVPSHSILLIQKHPHEKYTGMDGSEDTESFGDNLHHLLACPSVWRIYDAHPVSFIAFSLPLFELIYLIEHPSWLGIHVPDHVHRQCTYLLCSKRKMANNAMYTWVRTTFSLPLFQHVHRESCQSVNVLVKNGYTAVYEYIHMLVSHKKLRANLFFFVYTSSGKYILHKTCQMSRKVSICSSSFAQHHSSFW